MPEPNSGFIAVAGNKSHNLGLKEDGSIVAWGWNDYGQCNVPEPNEGFVAIAAGDYHSLGLKEDGSITAWGHNSQGQCNVPLPNSGFIDVAAGDYHSLGRKADGSIVAWGYNFYGQCNVPEPNSGFIDVAAGGNHTLGLKAGPTGTAFTYQGRLLDDNSAADEPYDLQFELYNNMVDGIQQGTTVEVEDIDVIDGYFTVQLDFGSDLFNGLALWLEIGVRPGDLEDPNEYTTLSPRQEVRPTPYAIYADKTRGTFVDESGNVGIGTTNPVGKLDVNGSIYQRGVELYADYVFETGYELESIEEHSRYMWDKKHLRAIPVKKFDENGQEIIEVGAHRKGIVEELEKAHIYIEQLHKRIGELQEQNGQMEGRIEKLEAIIGELGREGEGQ